MSTLNEINELKNLLNYCAENKISDIHLEKTTEQLQVRIRQDGLLENYQIYTQANAERLVSRLKIMANLDINSRSIQEGRANINGFSLRMAVIPLYNGEKLVLRILANDLTNLHLDRLGIPQPIHTALLQDIQKNSGLIILTGPTGSGKTTTLYSLLARLNSIEKNILTIEDPVEYCLPGINQIQLQYDLSFATTLKTILRLDPDIIFIGEIRDKETAQVAFRAALTGHLVFTTLHTRDTREALKRLKDLGIEDYLLEDTINCILSQKLYRKYCQCCQGVGCNNCRNGYAGRSGLFEYRNPKKFISFQEAANTLIKAKATAPEELLWITCE